MKYTKISSGAKWEDAVGYSRAVRAFSLVEISGTVASDGQKNIAPGDAYKQTVFILEKIKDVMKEAVGDLTNIVHTRIFETDISQWESIGRSHGEFFREVKPATSMVKVSRLIHEDYLVEI